MDNLERRTHARDVYSVHDSSRMGTAKVKKKEEADTRIIQERSEKYKRKEGGHPEKSPEQGLTKAKVLTIYNAPIWERLSLL